jgi:membrane-bound lytic murein transglycosylase B
MRLNRSLVLVAVAAVVVLAVGAWIASVVTAAQRVGEASPWISVPSSTETPVPADTPSAVTNAARAVIDPSWLATTSVSTGVPERALAAYALAALTESAASPSCHLGWNTLAAIGYVESAHGTIGGDELLSDGRPRTPIIGPALDGGAYGAIRDTDGGRLDGDSRWDHAVGPMQILPTTWERYAADGDGDGVEDPQDIDDAALAAAHYLCVAGGDLAQGADWTAAIRAYNHSDVYVDAVRTQALAYAGGAR